MVRASLVDVIVSGLIRESGTNERWPSGFMRRSVASLSACGARVFPRVRGFTSPELLMFDLAILSGPWGPSTVLPGWLSPCPPLSGTTGSVFACLLTNGDTGSVSTAPFATNGLVWFVKTTGAPGVSKFGLVAARASENLPFSGSTRLP
jgi:hypothetical protein